VTFVETIECPAAAAAVAIASRNNLGKQSGTNISVNHGNLRDSNHHSEVDDFPLPPPPLPIHNIQNSDATTNSDSSSILTSPSSTQNDRSDYVESRV